MVQLLDRWLTKNVTTVALRCDALGPAAFVGVVGRNYYPTPWDEPLHESRHAVVVHADSWGGLEGRHRFSRQSSDADDVFRWHCHFSHLVNAGLFFHFCSAVSFTSAVPIIL